MTDILFAFFVTLSAYCFYQFLIGKYKLSPLMLMLSVWCLAVGIPRLNLSKLEKPWSVEFWLLISVSLVSFIAGFFIADRFFSKHQFWKNISWLNRNDVVIGRLRILIYLLFFVSLIALYLFYVRAGNFPLLAQDPDVFRFVADEQVPGLINYTAQLARIFIPLSFFIMFWEGFNFKKHADLITLCLIGTTALILFASRTQIFFIDLWVMALYLFIRRPNLKQSVRFYPFFLIVSFLVLSAVPLIRHYKSYGSSSYLAGITQIDTSHYNPIQKFLVPIYVGVSFNMQALLHAQTYYQTHPIQHGKVSLDPFTNLFGKAIPALNKFKSHFDLGDIFYSWWNTGTYLFPFVQDFGTSAFFFIPGIIAAILTSLWHYWKTTPNNYLSLNLYAYAGFFIVMTIYLSFTVRAEMYLDLFFLFISYFFVSKKLESA